MNFQTVQVLAFTLLLLPVVTVVSATRKSYIVYLGAHSHAADTSESELNRVADFHHEFLGTFLGSKDKAKAAIIYSYKRHINGFAAVLEDDAVAEIAKHPKVISIFPNKGRRLHTTHSWDFMRLESSRNGVEVLPAASLWERARFGEDVIIANIDTGVWPESESFRDDGYGPVPSKWRGYCENNTREGVPCNRKLIGARYFSKGYEAYARGSVKLTYSARDHAGHGSHTLSTAGGNFVAGASVMGVGIGTAKGGSPRARVAAYKVCWQPIDGNECFDADILQAFDSAIHDGVDVLSISVGGDPANYFDDGLSIGALHAVLNGVIVVCSAGNSGPSDGTVSNVSPWMVTVAASTMDREFRASVELGNGLRLKGTSLSRPLEKKAFYPLISAAEGRTRNSTVADATLCIGGSLDREKVRGKIVVCLRGDTSRVDKGQQALLAGAAGMILCNDKFSGDEIIADPHMLPAAHISFTSGVALSKYIKSTTHPVGYIVPPEAAFDVKPSPLMASFSSKGPNTVTPEILKPDITAPGVDVIAAYSEAVSPTEEDFDHRRLKFNVLSGTSMSCPHISGIVGLLRTAHPDWSASAIRSAIMTTARTRDNTRSPMKDDSLFKATPFSYGAGHVQPNRAMDPGLVYDLTNTDYLNFLCNIGYNQTIIQLIAGVPHECHERSSVLDFNYPSITVPNLAGSMTLARRLKNVGSPGTYAARVHGLPSITVSVEPAVLTFGKIGQEKTFKVTLKAKQAAELRDYVFGHLVWSDGTHHVWSTIGVAAVHTP